MISYKPRFFRGFVFRCKLHWFQFNFADLVCLMKIHIPNPSDFVAGSIGGQYIQGGSSVDSLRTKRNGLQRNRVNAQVPLARFSRIARTWKTLTSTQKTNWYNWGVSNPAFASWDSGNALFAYWVYLAFNMNRAFVQNTVRLSPAGLSVTVAHSLASYIFTLSPFILTVSHDVLLGGGRCFFYVTPLYQNMVSVNQRSPRVLSWSNSSSSSSSNLNSVLNSRYGQQTQLKSVIITFLRADTAGSVWAPSAPFQLFPSDIP